MKMVMELSNIIIMNLEYQDREADNQTATFHKIPHSKHQDMDQSLAAISETPDSEQSHRGQSIDLPKPLIANPQYNDPHQFSPTPQLHPPESMQNLYWNDPNLTFHPSISTRFLYEDKSITKLKQLQQKLKEELRGLNDIVSEMLDKKYELVNQYESTIKQKKCYKKLMKNLEEEQEAYQSMLEADYPIKLQEQIERSAKQVSQIKKEVIALNSQLSKPLIKNIQQSDMKLQKLEKEIFETRMVIEKQKVLTNNKKEHLTDLKTKIKDKEANMKKLSHKINEYSQQCQEEDLIPQQDYKLLVQKLQQTKIKANRLSKINELTFKNKDAEFQRKLKELNEKQHSLAVISDQILSFTQKIKSTSIELQKIKIQKMITPQAKKIRGTVSDGSKKCIESRLERINTPETFIRKQKYSRTNDNNTPFKSHSIYNQHTQNDYSSIESKAQRTMTEPSDNDQRQELSLRKKKIYTELQKNMYFKKIEHTEIEKLSRILENSVTFEQSRAQQKQNSKKITLRLPNIRDNRPQRQQIPNESIIEQSKFIQIEQQRKQKKKSIEMHNRYIKQLKANRQALNRSNYQQLCNILNRDKLLIEEECEYELGDLIYNSKF